MVSCGNAETDTHRALVAVEDQSSHAWSWSLPRKARSFVRRSLRGWDDDVDDSNDNQLQSFTGETRPSDLITSSIIDHHTMKLL